MSAVVYVETVRRHLTSIAFWGYVGLVAVVSLGTARFNTPAAAWPTLVDLLAMIAGAQAIGPEFSSGTLQLILVKPVTRAAYLLSRVAGIATALWIAALIGGVAEIIGRLLAGRDAELGVIGAALVNSAAGSLLIVALLAFFGSFSRAYFNVAIYLVLQIGLGIGIALVTMAKWPFVAQQLQEVMRNLFPDAPRAVDTPWLLLVLSNAAIALVAACFLFRRREVPYGAD